MGLASILISANLATAIVAGVLIVYSFPHRQSKAVQLLIGLNVAYLWTSFSIVNVIISPEFESKAFWTRMMYSGLTVIPVSYLIFFSMIVSRWAWLRKSWVIALLYVIPFSILAMSIVPAWRDYVTTNYRPFSHAGIDVVKYDYGPAFKYHMALAYASLLLFFGLCARVIWKDSGVQRKQAVLLGLTLFITMIVDVSGVINETPLDWALIPTVVYCLNVIAIFYSALVLDLANITSLARRTIFDLIPDPVLVTDKMNRLITYNQAAERVFAFPNGATMKPVSSILNPQQLTPGAQSISSGDYELDLSAVVDRWNSPTGQLYFFRDLTEQKRAERKILELLKFSNEMLSLMSHDLSGNLHVQARLAGHVIEELPPEARSLGASLRDAASSSRDLVNNLVTWGRSLAPGLGVSITRPYEMNALCEEAIEFTTPIARAQGVTIRFEPTTEPLILKGDSGVISSAVRNLITNGIRASATGQSVVVSVAVVASEAIVEVRDVGIGMTEEKLNSLFSDGSAPASASVGGEKFGYGIGLRVSKKLLETQNGIIEISSGLGRGTVAKLRLSLDV